MALAPELTPGLREQIENTIRFLAVDAVESANSGHPGAPMGLARPALLLWERHLRFDPSEPEWPLRDRFVLSAGHASMLLYSLLHLFDYDVTHDDHPRVPPARQQDARAPGVRRYARRRSDDGAARPGLRARCGHGARRQAHGVAIRGKRSRRSRKPHRLRHRERRRPDGRRGLRGGVARRPPGPGQPRLPVRRQPDHDRRSDQPVLQREVPRRRFRGRGLARAIGRRARTSKGSTPRSRRPRPRRASRRSSSRARPSARALPL